MSPRLCAGEDVPEAQRFVACTCDYGLQKARDRGAKAQEAMAEESRVVWQRRREARSLGPNFQQAISPDRPERARGIKLG
eukprot:scaffold255408_cov36-Tisochrysis_lutea.AAC.5